LDHFGTELVDPPGFYTTMKYNKPSSIIIPSRGLL